MCATIISYLQPEHGPPLQALSKHSIIFPCALPIGLPQQVRDRLLKTYRGDLQARLRALVRRSQSSDTASSRQSQPLSDHDQNEAQSPHWEHKDAALQIIEDMEEMSGRDVIVEWENVKTVLSRVVVDACWWYMRDELKAVLTPP